MLSFLSQEHTCSVYASHKAEATISGFFVLIVSVIDGVDVCLASDCKGGIVQYTAVSREGANMRPGSKKAQSNDERLVNHQM